MECALSLEREDIMWNVEKKMISGMIFFQGMLSNVYQWTSKCIDESEFFLDIIEMQNWTFSLTMVELWPNLICLQLDFSIVLKQSLHLDICIVLWYFSFKVSFHKIKWSASQLNFVYIWAHFKQFRFTKFKVYSSHGGYYVSI